MEYIPTMELNNIFNSTAAQILDLYPQYKEQPFTISQIASDIDVSFKTALKTVNHLETQKLLIQVKKIRNAKAYKFNQKSPQLNTLKGIIK